MYYVISTLTTPFLGCSGLERRGARAQEAPGSILSRSAISRYPPSGGLPPAFGSTGDPRRAEAGPLHDNLMGAVGEAVEGAVGQDRIVEERDPLVHRPVARDEGRGAAAPLDEDVVDVARLLRRERAEPEVVEDEEIGRQPGAQLAVPGGVGPRLMKGEEQLGDPCCSAPGDPPGRRCGPGLARANFSPPRPDW